MASEQKKERPAPPEISPYLFPVILGVMGVWCLYDGWLTPNPAMQEHLLFNRVGSVILLTWALIDVIRTRRFAAQERTAEAQSLPQNCND